MKPWDRGTWGTARWNEVSRLFHEAGKLPPSEQGAFLDQQCGDDEELRRQVERMLAADGAPGDFLQSPVKPLLPRQLEQDHAIGPYRIVERVGAGNMGEVYRAERRQPFRQAVAIKVVDAGRINEEMVWRFQHERQILASLRHPNIPHIIDGGTLDDGRPWFALEYIQGERIDRYCNRLRLNVRQRVALMRQVCAAVSEAHRLAVVHRDLKPANILVTADGSPKLLDFGIAKIIEGAASFSDTLTQVANDLSASGDFDDSGSSPLTPLYASPEQTAPLLEPEDNDHPPVGVRSDVYSLGVVLYELLTGHPPYRRIHPIPILMKAVLSEVPLPASEVVGQRRELSRPDRLLTPESVARERKASPRSLRRQLRGDLDTILCHALKKQPGARYGSVELLDADLRAFLEGFPIMPRINERFYRGLRFARRHLLAMIAVSAALLSLATFFTMRWSSQQQLLETREALFGLAHIEVEELSDADFAKQLQQQVREFGDDLLLANNMTDLGHDLADRGHLRASLALHWESHSMRLRLLESQHPDLAVSYNNLAGAQLRLGQFALAEDNFSRDLAIREALYGLDSVQLSRSLNNLAALYQAWGGEHLTRARPLLDRALTIRRGEVRRLEAADADTFVASMMVLGTLNNLATQHLLEHRFADAEPLFLEVLEGLGEANEQRRAGVLRNLALVQLGLGRSQAAERSAREALSIYRRDFLHWQIADAESVLGACLASQDQLQQARFLLESSIENLRTSQTAASRHVREAEERNVRWLGG